MADPMVENGAGDSGSFLVRQGDELDILHESVGITENKLYPILCHLEGA